MSSLASAAVCPRESWVSSSGVRQCRSGSGRRLRLRAPQLRAVSQFSEEQNVLEAFLSERQSSGDLVSRLSDLFFHSHPPPPPPSPPPPPPLVELNDDGNVGGFLKLSTTQDWLLGDNSAPFNKKPLSKPFQDDRATRKALNLLRYQAIKRELWVVSIGIGTACTGYCFIAFSRQAAISYAVGVLFSCLYLQLLFKHADNISRDQVPQIFRRKKINKIGIRSDDLRDFFERTIKGSGMALSSPRLMIPVAIYGLWILSHHYFSTDLFDFQIVPAMLGLFVYKAAALVQVYRDNEKLRFVFPESDEAS